MATMSLASLSKGLPGITPAFGTTLHEAASVCLEECLHQCGVAMTISGPLKNGDLQLDWSPPTQQAKNCYQDLGFAAEFGAYGVAVLLIEEFTNLTVVNRSRKGTGYDFWLGPKTDAPPLFQGNSRLEVSGILRGERSALKSRLKAKIEQMINGSGTGPGYAVVVSFSPPETMVGSP